MRYDEQETFICFSPCANLLFGSVGEGNQRVLKLCGMQYIYVWRKPSSWQKEGKIKSSNCTYLSFVVYYFLYFEVKIYWLNGYVLKGYVLSLCIQLLKLVYYMWSMWAHVHQLPKRLKLKAAKLHVFISKFYQIHKRCFKSCVQLR